MVLTAGNHDFLRRDSAYLKFPWSGNVTGLWGERCQRVSFPEKDLCVYGCSYHSREITENLYREARPGGKETYQILLAHGGDEKHSPMDFRELASRGFTYTALGHIHRPGIFPGGRMAYAGALEPIDRNDQGPHGYMRVLCENGEVRAEFVPFARCGYQTLEIPLEKGTSQFELEERIRKSSGRQGKRIFIRSALQAPWMRKRSFPSGDWRAWGGSWRSPTSGNRNGISGSFPGSYRGSLIGEYVDHFAGKDSELEQKALYYGLEALLGARREE